MLAKQAFHSFTTQSPGFVSLPVFCEFAWVLARTYHRSRAEIIEASNSILGAAALEVQHFSIIQRALVLFGSSQADFADCCIAVLGEEAGCNYTLTFDAHASKLPGMRLLTHA